MMMLFPVAGAFLAASVALVGGIVWFIASSLQKEAAGRRELAARRGWMLEMKPAPHVAWRLRDDGAGWTLDCRVHPNADPSTSYVWQAPGRLNGEGTITLRHRSAIERMRGLESNFAFGVATRLMSAVGGADAAQAMRDFGKNAHVVEFRRPDMAEWKMLATGLSPDEASALFPDEAQRRFLSWLETLPPALRAPASVRITVRPDTLQVETEDLAGAAPGLEAWCDFCATLRRN